jgi:hypothetical protein
MLRAFMFGRKAGGGGGTVIEWLLWDFDPFNPLLDEDFLVTQVFE